MENQPSFECSSHSKTCIDAVVHTSNHNGLLQLFWGKINKNNVSRCWLPWTAYCLKRRMVAIFNNSRSLLTGRIDSLIYRIYLENTASVPRPFVLTSSYTDVCWGATTRDVGMGKRMRLARSRWSV